VRSSKQEQIHASIVTTLLALMDGIDNRGEIVVIAATNRPDSIDPAFRRPGRFDREFYFPLPNHEARRAILDIHTRGWEPAIEDKFKDELANLTKGYGGSDLRALCTEAAINAVQRTYPQVYQTYNKLEVDPDAVKIIPKDFFLSLRKIVSSTARQTGPVAEPLPKNIEPLLADQFEEIGSRLDVTLPQKKKILTALEEAEYDDPNDADGFEHEQIYRAFERGRIFRPRLLITGPRGMGQKYLASAVLHKLENVYVRTLDLGTLYGDPSTSPEALIISAFKEVRTQQPSVIFIPQVNIWYQTVSENVLQTFTSLLRSLAPNDAVLLLGAIETETNELPDPRMLKELFGFSSKHEYQIRTPSEESRAKFFESVKSYAQKRPSEFPDHENRKKRKLPELPLAKEEVKAKVEPTKEELKAQAKADRALINWLRIILQNSVDAAKQKYRIFRQSVISDKDIEYLYKEQNEDLLVSDLTPEQRALRDAQRPYEISTDKHGNRGLRQTSTGKFFYNINLQVIEARLSNGYYKRPKEFLWDLKTIAKDWNAMGNVDNMTKANHMHGNAMGEVELLEMKDREFFSNCEALYHREKQREKMALQKAQDGIVPNIPPPAPSTSIPTGPLHIGEPILIPGLPQPNADLLHESNATAHTNGDTVPSQLNGSYPPIPGISDLSSGTRPQFPAGNTVTPSNPTTNDHTPLDVHKQGDLDNSLTTSESKTTRTSDSSGYHFAQSATGGTQPQSNPMFQNQHPDFSSYFPHDNLDGSLPDTFPGSQRTNSARQTLDQPLSGSNGVGDSQNDEFTKPQMTAREMQQQGAYATAPPTSQPMEVEILTPPTPPPPFVLDEVALDDLHSWIVAKTSELTVEQLEMVDSRCMAAIWNCKGMWDRTLMLKEIEGAVEEVLDDIEWQKGIVPIEVD
jgi:AAA+ superfamily predicted ATPase